MMLYVCTYILKYIEWKDRLTNYSSKHKSDILDEKGRKDIGDGGRPIVWQMCMWKSCASVTELYVTELCLMESCVTMLRVQELCVSELCVKELCVKELCVK